LDWDDWDIDQVGSANDVPLELHPEGQSGLLVILDRVASYPNFFIGFWVLQVPWPHKGVLTALDVERYTPWENQINIVELVSCSDHGRHQLLLSDKLESVGGLTDADGVDPGFLLGDGSLTEVHFSKFARIQLNTGR